MSGQQIQSFPFSADRHSRVLILGSMPGAESLRQQRYYAHPRNLFWDFMGELFEAGRKLPYEQRLAVLRKNHIALWDVAHTCRRKGSLDSNIADAKANDFDLLFRTAPHIQAIFFNGQKAAQLFQKMVEPHLNHEFQFITLPSTSPANASISKSDKINAWNQLKTALND